MGDTAPQRDQSKTISNSGSTASAMKWGPVVIAITLQVQLATDKGEGRRAEQHGASSRGRSASVDVESWNRGRDLFNVQ